MCGKWIVVLMIALSPCFLLAGEENEVIETAAVKTPEKEASGGGLGTAILTRQEGAWRLRHLHTNVVRK